MERQGTYATIGIVSFLAGIAVSFFTLPLWVVLVINAAREGSRTDWLGFCGSIIGALMTIIAAYSAWWAITRQTQSARDIAEAERKELYLLVSQDLDAICRAANLVWRSANRALEADPLEEITKWRFTNVLTFIQMLPPKENLERIAAAAKGLSPLSRRKLDSVVFCLGELSRVTESYVNEPPPGQDKRRYQARMLRSLQLWFSIFAREVALFDPELAKIFVGTERVEIAGPTVAEKFESEWQSILDDEDWIRRRAARGETM